MNFGRTKKKRQNYSRALWDWTGSQCSKWLWLEQHANQRLIGVACFRLSEVNRQSIRRKERCRWRVLDNCLISECVEISTLARTKVCDGGMAHLTSDSSRRSFPRSHLVLIAFMLLNFTKCNVTLSKLQTPRLSENILLQESLVIPTSNAESEARRLYDEALKQYGDLGKTLKEICQPWKARGCACTGTSDEVILTCRAAELTTVPENLPEELIKL